MRFLLSRKIKITSDGFTLIEVLISVVILSTGIVVVLQGMHTALNALEFSVERSRAALLLRSRIVDIQASAMEGNSPASLDSGGRFASPYEDYRWSMGFNQSVGQSGVAGETDSGKTYEVDLTIQRDGSERTYRGDTLVYVAPSEGLPGGGL